MNGDDSSWRSNVLSGALSWAKTVILFVVAVIAATSITYLCWNIANKHLGLGYPPTSRTAPQPPDQNVPPHTGRLPGPAAQAHPPGHDPLQDFSNFGQGFGVVGTGVTLAGFIFAALQFRQQGRESDEADRKLAAAVGALTQAARAQEQTLSLQLWLARLEASRAIYKNETIGSPAQIKAGEWVKKCLEELEELQRTQPS